jgi:hypothetical protein
MFKFKVFSLFFGLFCALAFVAGCSDDSTTQPTPTQQSYPIDLVDVAGIIEQAAPPAYDGPVGAPAEIDTMWYAGQSPLLEKVFSSHEPMALHSNIEEFKMSYSILTHTIRVNQNGAVILGTYVDSHLVDMGDDNIMMHYTAIVTALDGTTPMPAAVQEVMGMGVDVDYLVDVTVTEMPGSQVFIGMRLTDTVQRICQWDEGTSDDDEQTRIVYASLDPSDSSFVFKGVGYCQHPVNDQWPNGDLFCWAYSITADANSDFSYRMSYFSNGTPGMTFLHCFLGGGNKDTEFALRYRMFSPADTNVCDSIWMSDQVFGPDYSEGAGLLSAYEEYLDEELLFLYDAVPAAMIPNPWE